MEPMGVAMWEDGSAWRRSMSRRLPRGGHRSVNYNYTLIIILYIYTNYNTVYIHMCIIHYKYNSEYIYTGVCIIHYKYNTVHMCIIHNNY